MGSAGQFEIDGPAVRIVGSTVDEVARALASAGAAASGRLSIPGPDGWDAAAESRAVQQMWLAELRRLSGAADEFGRNLVAAAEQYAATDRTAAGGIRQSGPPR